MNQEPLRIGKAMSSAGRFAIVLRQAQWDLDHVAFKLPRGEVSDDERNQLADTLTALAAMLREQER